MTISPADIIPTYRNKESNVIKSSHLQLLPAAMPVAALMSGANSVGPEKYTAVTQSLYAWL